MPEEQANATTAAPTAPAQPVILTEAMVKAKADEFKKYSQRPDADWKVVIDKAKEIAELEKTYKAQQRDAFLKEVSKVEARVLAVLTKALQPLVDAKELDKADGVWFTWDFGDKLQSCRIMKSSAKKASGGGGGGGKKFDISTDDLLKSHGAEVYKDGKTFQQAWDEDPDKNKRYAIRNALLKVNGDKK